MRLKQFGLLAAGALALAKAQDVELSAGMINTFTQYVLNEYVSYSTREINLF